MLPLWSVVAISVLAALWIVTLACPARGKPDDGGQRRADPSEALLVALGAMLVLFAAVSMSATS